MFTASDDQFITSEYGFKSSECGFTSSEDGLKSSEYGLGSTDYEYTTTEQGFESTEDNCNVSGPCFDSADDRVPASEGKICTFRFKFTSSQIARRWLCSNTYINKHKNEQHTISNDRLDLD